MAEQRRVAWLGTAGARRTALLCMFGLFGCEPRPAPRRFSEPTSERPYRVFAPQGRDARGSKAVLFALHAYATAPDVLVESYALVRQAAERGWLLVVPEGLRDAQGKVHWNASSACCGEGPRQDDLAYLRAVLRDVGSHYRVDKTRVYALGVSNGGFMAHRWACSPEGELAGIVSIAGAAQGPDDPPCRPGRSVNVVEVHGTEDGVILYAGSHGGSNRYPSATEGARRWAALNGKSGPSVVSHRRSLFLEPIKIESWNSGNARVSLWSIDGGDHLLRSARYLVSEFLDAIASTAGAQSR